MDIVALDDPRRRLKPGEKGEIRIKGPNVTKGYWNAPEETAAAFVDGYLLTGDIGYMDEDGYFYLVDRKKDMIISGGFNVYPRTIEEAIYEHPTVAEVSVIGVPDSYRGEAAKAFVQLKPGAATFTLEELRAFLADKLGRHEMPAHLEFRDALPKTAVGKLSKKELIEEERQKLKPRLPPSESSRALCPGSIFPLAPEPADGWIPATSTGMTKKEEERTMVDAVIVSTARTPIGRAVRGVFNLTHGADMGGHVIAARGQARRHRARRRRGRDAGLRQSRGRHRRQHRAPGGDPRRPAGDRRRPDRQPLLLLRPAGDRAGRAQHHAGRRAGRRGGRARVRSASCR